MERHFQCNVNHPQRKKKRLVSTEKAKGIRNNRTKMTGKLRLMSAHAAKYCN
jgi:hypothetical protein